MVEYESTLRPRWKAVPGTFNGRDAKEDEMTLKLARNFSCSSPSGSRLTSMLAITFSVNCQDRLDQTKSEEKSFTN